MATASESLFNFGISGEDGVFFESNISDTPSGDPGGFFNSATLQTLGGISKVGASIIEFNALQGSLESKADQADENARIAELNARRTRIARDRTNVNALNTANNVMASNIVAAYASGIRLTGTPSRANEAVRSQLDIFRFSAFLESEITAREFERSADFFRKQAEQFRDQARGSTLGLALKIIGTVAAVAATVITAGAAAAPLAAAATASAAAAGAGASAVTAAAAAAAASASVAASITATTTALGAVSIGAGIGEEFV